MAPQRLALEITEIFRTGRLDVESMSMNRLRGFGVRSGIDDFGHGQMSPADLSGLPIDSLVTDRTP